ncbi:DUF456 family protein [Halospeciosus flavus]|uniref:DUF456 family protein n=1 Tax=Halospeciosus flavus TaxID=3032283 RepID=A0ABD5Z259_9EURY|nr:DUF456 family protein [Halospeciosus flavus]
MEMLDPASAVALLLVLTAVVVSVHPTVPSSPFALGGLFVYWWTHDFMMPEPGSLLLLAVLGAVLVKTEQYAARHVPAKSDVASRTVALGAAVGLVLYVLLGVPGLVAGVVVAVACEKYESNVRAGTESYVAGVGTEPAVDGAVGDVADTDVGGAVSSGVEGALEDTARVLVASGLQLVVTSLFSAAFVVTTKLG